MIVEKESPWLARVAFWLEQRSMEEEILRHEEFQISKGGSASGSIRNRNFR